MKNSLQTGRVKTGSVPVALLGGLAASLFSIYLFGKVSDEVLEHETMLFDTRIIDELQRLRTPTLDRIMSTFTATGEPWAIGLVTGLTGLNWFREGRKADLATLLLATVGGGALNQLLKLIFRRDRPALKLRRAHASGSSYPSGHAMTTLTAYGTVAYLIGRRGLLSGNSGAVLIWVPTLALCGFVGTSRAYLEVHYPTDVMAGWAVGTIWLTTCGIVRAFMEPEES